MTKSERTRLEALKAIAERHRGKLYPRDVVKEAQVKDSPLHNSFCWDDTEAGYRYRIIQAQELIRTFRVQIETDKGKVTVPVFIGVTSDRTGRSANNPYRLMVDVAKNESLCAEAVADAMAQLVALRKRYNYLKQLSDVWAAIDAHCCK